MTITESIIALKINAFILFNFDFAKNTILSWFFFYFSIIDLHFLIPTAVAQIFNPITELVIPIGIPVKEAKIEIETHPVIVEVKKSV